MLIARFRVFATLTVVASKTPSLLCQAQQPNLLSSVISRLVEHSRAFLSTTTSSTMTADNNGVQNGADKFEKLPTNAKPSHYNIKLQPNLTNFTFKGYETIDLKILDATSKLKFHSNEIEISSASYTSKDGKALASLPVSYDKKWETAEVTFPQELPMGEEGKLVLEFTGVLNDKMKGFYRSSYKNQEGKEVFMATTQFESTYARKAFPCWDEPALKATFDIALVVDEKLTALSNMNVIGSKSLSDGLKEYQYATTPIMSTYLLAFAIGELEYVEGKTKDGVLVRMYTVPGKKHLGGFSVEVAVKALDWFGDFFAIKYPLPKCDLIAIPDFSMGAMENWGLVTYREILLLLDPAKTSKMVKSRICLVIAHELAHQWFGNLVTMKWWTDLWLKEGFASFMEYLFTAENYPEFEIWMRFVTDEVAAALNLDALRSSHPIEVPIENPNELEEIYDSITYAKSNSVIRMLYSYLGNDKFRDGLRAYLKKYEYSNAITVDLWNGLGQAANSDVKTLMQDWTQKMGFPLVSVEQRQEGNKRILTLTQARFIADGTKDSEDYIWQIPINIATGSDPDSARFKVLFTEKQKDVTLDGVGANEWVKLNSGLTGYYRVEYSQSMLDALLPAIKDQSLPALDRFNLASDLFALVRAGKVSATMILDLVEACVDEDNPTVREILDGAVSVLGNVVARMPESKPKFDAFVRKSYAKIAAKLGWEPKEGETNQVLMMRGKVLGRLGMSNDKEVIAKARSLFRDFVDNNAEIQPDIRGPIFQIVARHGGQAAQDDLKKVFEETESSEVQRNALFAMGMSDDAVVHKNALHYGVDGTKVRLQDLGSLFFGVTSSKDGQETGWAYFKENMDRLVKKFGAANSNIFLHLVAASTSGHCGDDVADDVDKFFSSCRDATTLDRPKRQSVERIRLNAGLLKRNGDAIAKWLSDNGF